MRCTSSNVWYSLRLPQHLHDKHQNGDNVRPNVERLVVPRESGHDALPVVELRPISGVDEVVDDAELRNGVLGEYGVGGRRRRRMMRKTMRRR